MTSTVGEEAVWPLLSSNDIDQQNSIIAQKFIQRELDAARAEMTQLHQHDHQQNELLSQKQSQSAVAASTRDFEDGSFEVPGNPRGFPVEMVP